MRFGALVLASVAVLCNACGTGDKGRTKTDTAAAIANAPARSAGSSTQPVAPLTGAAATSATSAAAVGATHEVNMVGDEKGYRFEPATLTIKQGDAVKFIMVSGGPHNVAFDNVTGPAHDQLSANMGPNQTGDLSSPMLINPNESYTISFAKVPAGTYSFHCTPHLAMGMKGSITVQ